MTKKSLLSIYKPGVFFKTLKYNQILCHEDNQEYSHETKAVFSGLIPKSGGTLN